MVWTAILIGIKICDHQMSVGDESLGYLQLLCLGIQGLAWSISGVQYCVRSIVPDRYEIDLRVNISVIKNIQNIHTNLFLPTLLFYAGLLAILMDSFIRTKLTLPGLRSTAQCWRIIEHLYRESPICSSHLLYIHIVHATLHIIPPSIPHSSALWCYYMKRGKTQGYIAIIQ